ncbi:MAG: winged helix-turn-helix transcriptional regulator [Spirochaetales bacterium]|nr:winged helix-turn-helix transcriptional regulator [Spirochaetales bacterium]
MNREELARLHKALSLPVRLRILELIAERPLCVKAITRCLDITQPAVSQHLAVLRQAGLVSAQKRGYMVHYSLERERLQALRRAMELFARHGGATAEEEEAKVQC